MVLARYARLFLAAGLISVTAYAASQPAQPLLQYISRGKSNRIIIFVDGLTTEPDKTFRWGQGVPSWPELMAADIASEKKQLPLARYDLAELSFNGAPEGQRSIPQLATKGLAELKAKGVLEGYESIVFVAYSAGGLVLKSMLIQSSITGASALGGKTKSVFLLSVPAQGRAAADFLALLNAKRTLTTSFAGNDVAVFLQGLESLWSEYLASRGPTRPLKVYCLHETEPTYGVAVKPGQYATEGCDESGEQSGADHNTIAKPGSRDAGAYRWVRGSLADYFQRFPSDPGKPKPGSVAVASTETAAPVVPAAKALPLKGPIPPKATDSAEAGALTTQSSSKLAVPSAGVAAVTAGSSVAMTPVPAPSGEASAAPKPVATPAAEPPAKVALAAPRPVQSTLAPPTVAPLPQTRFDVPAAVPRRAASSRPPVPPIAQLVKVGDWTFALKGADCNLPVQLWVVQVQDRQVRSDNWRTRIGVDGKFAVQTSSSCATELVRGTISGKRGTGWYLYADPCHATYCRVRFKMTWRLPESAWKKR